MTRTEPTDGNESLSLEDLLKAASGYQPNEQEKDAPSEITAVDVLASIGADSEKSKEESDTSPLDILAGIGFAAVAVETKADSVRSFGDSAPIVQESSFDLAAALGYAPPEHTVEAGQALTPASLGDQAGAGVSSDILGSKPKAPEEVKTIRSRFADVPTDRASMQSRRESMASSDAPAVTQGVTEVVASEATPAPVSDIASEKQAQQPIENLEHEKSHSDEASRTKQTEVSVSAQGTPLDQESEAQSTTVPAMDAEEKASEYPEAAPAAEAAAPASSNPASAGGRVKPQVQVGKDQPSESATKPTKQTKPAKVDAPTEAELPTKAENPAKPTAPTEEADPTKAAPTTKSTTPTKSAAPTKETSPTKAATPAEAAPLAKPTTPTEAALPTKAATPTEAVPPTKSATPVKAVPPAKAAKPTPAKAPVGTIQPDEPSTFSDVRPVQAVKTQRGKGDKEVDLSRKLLRVGGSVLVVVALAFAAYAAYMFVTASTLGGSVDTNNSQASDADIDATGGDVLVEPSSITYEYTVSGPESVLCTAVEVAEFDETRTLTKSTITTTLPDNDLAWRFLEGTQADFGDTFVEGYVDGAKAIVVIDESKQHITKDAYTALLMQNASDCRILEE